MLCKSRCHFWGRNTALTNVGVPGFQTTGSGQGLSRAPGSTKDFQGAFFGGVGGAVGAGGHDLGAGDLTELLAGWGTDGSLHLGQH